MLVVWALKGRAHPLGQLVGVEQPIGFYHFALAVNPLSARSGDIFGNRQMLVVWRSEGRANPICQLVSPEQTVGLYNLALAMDPLGLHRIEPRALYGQQTAYDPHSISTLFDPAVVGGYPLPDLAAYVPGGVVPDQEPHLLTTDRFELL